MGGQLTVGDPSFPITLKNLLHATKCAMRPRALYRDSLAEHAGKAIPLSRVKAESNVVGA